MSGERKMGIPTGLCTLMFATSRVAAWTAYVMEQHGNNRFSRPRTDDTGLARVADVPADHR